MKLITQLRSLTLTLVFCLLLVPESARACDCDLPLSGKTVSKKVIEARKKAAAVFAGTVVEITKNPEGFYICAKLKVKVAWKGLRHDEVRLFTGLGGGDCGYRFEVGQSYLIYAYTYNKTELGTNICQRTANLIDAGEDLKVLGAGRDVKASVVSNK